MKKSLFIYIVIAAAVCLTACDSFFDINTKDQATMQDVMSRSTSVRQYLARLYYYIPREENLRQFEGGTSVRSDEALHGRTTHEEAGDWHYIRRGDYSSASSVDAVSGNFWNRFYIAINECTTFINNLDYDKEDPPSLIRCMEGEARFLRAYYYFSLFRHYGPVFIWMDENGKPITPDELIQANTVDRNTVDENINFMISELDAAKDLLPLEISEVASAGANMGRATKGAAMALKARILLYAASPLYNGQNGTGIYDGLVNSRGEKLFPAYDPTKWDLAAQAAKDIISVEKTDGETIQKMYRLTETGNPMTSFADAAKSYQSIWFNSWNTETIWGWWYRQWSDYQGSIGGEIAFSAPSGGKICSIGYSLITPSLKLIDAYPMAESGRYPVVGYDGDDMLDYSRPKVDPLSGYSATGWEDNYQQIIDVDPSWATPFKAHKSTVGRDARFYASWIPNGFWWPCKEPNGKTAPLRFTCYNNAAECTSPYSDTEGCNRVGYCWRRLYKADNPLKETTDYTSISYVYPAFRLAEVYLAYAEACNEKPERDAKEAIKYIDMVRARSGLKGLNAAYPEINFNSTGGTIAGVTRTGQEWLRWIIRQERMVEFAFEGSQRHYDCNRNMLSVKEYNVENWTLHVKADNYEDSYERVSDDFIGGRSVFRQRDYLFPFGSAQLAEMTNLTQNPGW